MVLLKVPTIHSTADPGTGSFKEYITDAFSIHRIITNKGSKVICEVALNMVNKMNKMMSPITSS